MKNPFKIKTVKSREYFFYGFKNSFVQYLTYIGKNKENKNYWHYKIPVRLFSFRNYKSITIYNSMKKPRFHNLTIILILFSPIIFLNIFYEIINIVFIIIYYPIFTLLEHMNNKNLNFVLKTLLISPFFVTYTIGLINIVYLINGLF